MRHPMPVPMAQKHRLAQHQAVTPGIFLKVPGDGGIEIGDQVVGRVTPGADDLLLQPARKSAFGELAYGVMSGAKSGKNKRHL